MRGTGGITSLLLLASLGASAGDPRGGRIERVVPNDNRVAAGTLRGGVLTLRLEARLADWHPDGDSAPGATIPAFAEEGRATRIPGPMIRVRAGVEAAVTVRNSLADTLTVYGLHDRRRPASPDVRRDSLVVPPGATRTARFRLDAPGTYYYTGTTMGRRVQWRTREDAQLTGAIVVDPPGVRAPSDRVFVIGMWSDTAGRVLLRRSRILAVVNGRSWPHTERLEYATGDTVRWRVLNATGDSHPMHLHGFYFTVESRGDDAADTLYAEADRRMAVTEDLKPGTTMQLAWVPDRPGNWLFHCHLPDHFGPRGSLGLARPASVHAAGAHEMNHALGEMNGLVMGIRVRQSRQSRLSTVARRRSVASDAPRRSLRLLVRANGGGSEASPIYAFALQRGDAAPAPDSGGRVGPTIVLERGQPVRIVVVNTLAVPTAVHWHGIELESYYDGVPGFSGDGPRVTPMIAPGDSFEVRFTPPRAGTFIYHTHADEERQQLAGLAGPIVVLEPGARFDPATDIPVMISSPRTWEDELKAVLLDGSMSPAPHTLRAGVAHRLRFVNMTMHRPGIALVLLRDGVPVPWRPLAKDGADLPASRRVARPGLHPISIGETLDLEITPDAPGDLRIEVRMPAGQVVGALPLHVVER